MLIGSLIRKAFPKRIRRVVTKVAIGIGILIGLYIGAMLNSELENGIIHLFSFFPTDFDWGSFWGGVIGAIGAFGAALLAFYLQRIPSRRRMKVELKIKVHRQFSRSRLELIKVKDTNLSNAVACSQNTHEAFQETMPLAAECDWRAFELLTELLSKINGILDGIGVNEYQNEKYMTSNASVTRGNDVIKAVLKALNECQEKI